MLEVIDELQDTILTIRLDGEMSLTTSPAVSEKVTPERLAGMSNIMTKE